MLDLVIFSKDRACQLDLLLRSVKAQFYEWSEARIVVLYTYSTWSLRYAYDQVRAAHPEFEFVCERDIALPFKQATLDLIGQRPLVAFLVDDDVFKESFTMQAPEMLAFQADPQIMCVSLRMDPDMDYVYTQRRAMLRPTFSPRNIWDWTVSDGDWNYPMSLDGHIFRRSEIVPLLERIEFRNPNSLEFELSKQPLQNPLAACFDVAKIINLPMNRVQDAAPNRHAGGDARRLNARFLSGQRLALSTVAGVRSRSPHHELELQWEPWERAPKWVYRAAVVDARAAVAAKRLKRLRRNAERALRLLRRVVAALPGRASH